MIFVRYLLPANGEVVDVGVKSGEIGHVRTLWIGDRSRLVSAYSKFGCINHARKVFDTVPLDCISNILLWNSILRAHNKNEEFQRTLRLYDSMRGFRVFRDRFSFPLVIRACAALAVDSICRNVHCHVVHLGFQNHLHVCNELLNMYGMLA
ncbi:hypothetical protein POM88_012946 [Heracleum sosnowskyi]|uniref:Pentatricopeptide repeat-containing protein n=1 Tax=Heracleum sosnowskyi TaxID=360622 RepID=A0AAD8IXN5_9APIA|nr:hypothetical protein POM88_012946 [Heracleum sosnowskyi]